MKTIKELAAETGRSTGRVNHVILKLGIECQRKKTSSKPAIVISDEDGERVKEYFVKANYRREIKQSKNRFTPAVREMLYGSVISSNWLR